jgi:hypothetical protein
LKYGEKKQMHTTMDARCNSITHGTLGKVSKIKVSKFQGTNGPVETILSRNVYWTVL